MSTLARMFLGGLILFAAGWVCGSLSRENDAHSKRRAAPRSVARDAAKPDIRKERAEKPQPPSLEWSRSSAAETAKSIAALAPGRLREAALESAIEQIPAKERFDGIQALIRALPPGTLQYSAFQCLVDRYLAERPDDLARYARSFPPGAMKNNALHLLASKRACVDVEASLALANEITGSEARQSALADVGANWAASDPVAAANHFIDQTEVLSNIVESWSDREPIAALTWVRDHLIGDKRSELLRDRFSAFAANDPSAAVEFFGTLDAEAQKVAASSLAAGWAEVDPVKAAAWVQRLPAGEVADEALTEVVEHWADQDPNGAASWIEQLPGGARRDDLVASFTSHVMGQDPVGALAWARTLGNSTLRMDVVVSLFRDWMRDDPDSASAEIRKSDLLDGATRAKLLKPAQ